MVKYKCFKAECPQCKSNGSIQLFINNNLEVRYARTRHDAHLTKDSKKPQFTYCKIENLEALKTLIEPQGISLSTENTIGQAGQYQKVKTTIDLKEHKTSRNTPKTSGRSLVWLGHQPPTLTTRVQIPATAFKSAINIFSIYGIIW